jgi:hypothetical protein
MDKQILLNKLSQVADSLDDQNYIKQADKVTEIMVKVAFEFNLNPFADLAQAVTPFVGIAKSIYQGPQRARDIQKATDENRARAIRNKLIDKYVTESKNNLNSKKSSELTVADERINFKQNMSSNPEFRKTFQTHSDGYNSPQQAAATYFDIYVLPDYQDRFNKEMGGKAYFDESGNPTKPWVPPVWDKK